jgi:hypothetical protein
MKNKYNNYYIISEDIYKHFLLEDRLDRFSLHIMLQIIYLYSANFNVFRKRLPVEVKCL